MTPLIVLAVVVLVPLLALAAMYNSLVRAQNHCDEAWSNVDTELKRRYELIPNLVSTVKGYARHEQDGPRYVYLPVVPAERARRTALRHLVDTFFEGSAERAALALIKLSDAQISNEALERLAELARRAEREGR